MNGSLINLFDFFLPRFCPGCNKKLSSKEEPVCKECLSSIFIPDQSLLKNEFNRKFASTKIITDFYSTYIFESDKTLQNIIHALKYAKKFSIGTYLGKILSEGIVARNWSIDIVIPVPIHHLKKAERGYNQSDFIAKGIGKSLKIPYSVNLVKRTRYTESQTGLDASNRAKNVENAFKVRKPKEIRNKNLLLVDDVITTGATTLECAKVLMNSGAGKIYACSVGIAE
jgi:competence protein ComFC